MKSYLNNGPIGKEVAGLLYQYPTRRLFEKRLVASGNLSQTTFCFWHNINKNEAFSWSRPERFKADNKSVIVTARECNHVEIFELDIF